MDINSFLNNYYKIYHNNILIASGKCLGFKNNTAKTLKKINWPGNCISFDEKIFFNLNSTNLQIIQINSCDSFLIDLKQIKTLKITHWKYAQKYYNYDIFIENSYNQLDPEIQPLVKALNDFDNIYTLSSCSGHNKQPAYIDIKFNNLMILKNFLNILESKKFKYTFILKNSPTIVNSHSDGIVLKLETIHKGKEAYENIQLLTKYLKAFNLF